MSGAVDGRQRAGHLRPSPGQGNRHQQKHGCDHAIRRDGAPLSLRLRLVAKPENDVAQLLAHLGLQLPLRPNLIENVVPKTGG